MVTCRLAHGVRVSISFREWLLAVIASDPNHKILSETFIDGAPFTFEDIESIFGIRNPFSKSTFRRVKNRGRIAQRRRAADSSCAEEVAAQKHNTEPPGENNDHQQAPEINPPHDANLLKNSEIQAGEVAASTFDTQDALQPSDNDSVATTWNALAKESQLPGYSEIVASFTARRAERENRFRTRIGELKDANGAQSLWTKIQQHLLNERTKK